MQGNPFVVQPPSVFEGRQALIAVVESAPPTAPVPPATQKESTLLIQISMHAFLKLFLYRRKSLDDMECDS